MDRDTEPKTEKPEAPISPIQCVVFDWDNTLSDQVELGNEGRTLAFPDETLRVFEVLHSLGIYIKITSQQTSAKAIKNCLHNAGMSFISDNDIICGADAKNRTDMLTSLWVRDTDNILEKSQI